ncbi:Metallo-dependent phosphatase-like protein [Colletotrichum phormii]|uniref:Metallo-dependent phosphatase-like protein n=1 Tax=Colletotrichum phormii TaxID=359342 RepID=A0AAI9ZKC6_9PEZI|nr:Metallo-dependent phosphatase-like protein [Colletotrichum phormii]KAK1625120.1 Metallo-dependent phosphatase-like protein [Colletotrichum phormii]
MSSTTQTRFLIISDTHGHIFPPETMPLIPVDVLIHCGDLTHHSKMDEYRQTLIMLKAFKAPLTLVIAGNHDFFLDTVAFKAKIEEANRIYAPAPPRGRSKGILLLDEGTHELTLVNGARLKVYAGPYTPSSSSSERWGFSYNESEGHVFDIKTDTDIVITHGPPRGIMDMSADQKRIGCSDLFVAIAKSQPRLHCFGHVHGGWGAKNVAWRPQISDKPSHFGDIDHGKSEVVDNLATLGGTQFESEEDKITREGKLERYRWQRCCSAGYLRADMSSSEPKSTMFVNAALEANGELQRFPWIIDIDLPRSEICMAPKTEGKRKREESDREIVEARELSDRS